MHIGPKIEMRVVTLGLDGAGKTSLLFKLKQDEFVNTIPTIGMNIGFFPLYLTSKFLRIFFFFSASFTLQQKIEIASPGYSSHKNSTTQPLQCITCFL